MKSTSGPVPYSGSFIYKSADGGTRVTLDFEAELGGFFKLAEPLVVRAAKSQIEADATLKDIMEARAE